MGLKIYAKLGKKDKSGHSAAANTEANAEYQVPGGLSPARFWLLSVGYVKHTHVSLCTYPNNIAD